MDNSFEVLHWKWTQRLFELHEWEPYFIFGFNPPRLSPLVEALESNLKCIKRVERKLAHFCDEIGFSGETEELSDIERSIGADFRRLPTSLSQALLDSKRTIDQHRVKLESELEYLRSNNKRYVKPGPRNTPAFFAEHVLVGIQLHSGSEAGQRVLRKFLEPQGELSEWLKSNGSEEGLRVLISATGDKDDLKQWSFKRRQTYERIVLSAQLRFEVKSIRNYKSELTQLRTRVARKAAQIARPVGI